MSFFFTKAQPRHNPPQRAAGKPQRLGAAPLLKRNVASLWRAGCTACPLNSMPPVTPRMVPTLAAKTLVYFLAEAPSDEDENTGRPLTGPSGKLLRDCIPRNEAKNCSFDNVVNCRPPKNRTPVWQETECCRPRRIKWIEEAKPALIVGLGIVPLYAMLGSSDMAGMRGRFFAIKIGNHSCWYMPTYHPSFILKIAFNKNKPLNSKFGHCFRLDIKRAFKHARKLKPPKVDSPAEVVAEIKTYNGDIKGVLTALKKATAAPLKAIDLETKGLRPFADDAAIMTAAVSYDDINFSFAVDHPNAQWSPQERTQILTAFRDLVIDPNSIKVAHNLPFEMEWLIWLYGKEIADHASWECTQMQAHFIDERRGKQAIGGDDNRRSTYQSLDFLCKQYFGIGYKAIFKLNKKDMSKSDLNETLRYNAVDTKYTLRLFILQQHKIFEEGMQAAYLDALPRQMTVAVMQTLGVGVDQTMVTAFQKKLAAEINELEVSISNIDVVKDFIRDKKEFNPASTKDVLLLFGTYLGREEVKVLQASGNEKSYRYTVDKNVLEKIDHPLAALILKFRNKSKLKSTYVDVIELGKGAQIYPDGLIHCNFNTTFTETGRTSCLAPWVEILTRQGMKPIKDICLGDEVWTHKNRWKKVTALWRKGVQPMLNFHFGNGKVLTCTKNHRLLLPDVKWLMAEDIHLVFQALDPRSKKYSIRSEFVSEQGAYFYGGNCQTFEHTGIKYQTSGQKKSFKGRIQSNQDNKILCLKIGGKESNDGEVPGTTSSLGWGLSGWSWVSNPAAQRGEKVCASYCDDGSSWIDENSRMGRSTSHKWKQNRQFFGQFGFGNKFGSSDYSLQGIGDKIVEIEGISFGGSHEVYDITIEEDASYLSCGVFSHNSDEPNMQNFPSRNDSWVRRQIVAGKGHVLLAFDYGQLEACTAAMCSKDKVLVKALWEDYDIHLEWTHRIVKRYPAILGSASGSDAKAISKLRSVIKNKLVFPAIFGAQNSSIAGYLKAPEDVIDDLMDDFWKEFYGLKDWQDTLMKRYYDEGIVVSHVGRPHRYPLTRNQVINHPVQCLAAEIVCDAMNRLSMQAIEENNWHIHPRLNIHDDLSFIVPDNDEIIEDSVKKIYTTMLTPPYDCVNVPLSVKASVGYNWYGFDEKNSKANPNGMHEIGKFWSHRDL